MGKFIHLVRQYQLRSGNTEEGYSFEERPELREILNVVIMDSEVSTVLPEIQGYGLSLRRCNYRGSHLHLTATITLTAHTSRALCRVIIQTGRGTLHSSASSCFGCDYMHLPVIYSVHVLAHPHVIYRQLLSVSSPRCLLFRIPPAHSL